MGLTRRDLFAGLAVAGACLFTLFALKFLPFPFVWISLGWLVTLIAVAALCSRTWVRMAAVNLGAVVLVVGAFEAFLVSSIPERTSSVDEATDLSGDVVARSDPHAVLGWAPASTSPVRWRRFIDGDQLFEVTYTIDEGLRGTPQEPTDSASCVLFFGGSFTFGAGVEDAETMPARVAAAGDGGLEVYNFGYSGYGPHQMLASLEHGLVEERIDCEPVQVVYQGIVDHVSRVADRVAWAYQGPRYVMDDAGSVRYAGQFTDSEYGPFTQRVLDQFAKSLIGVNLMTRVRPSDVELLAAVVDESRRRIEARYPDADFDVLFWDVESELTEGIVEAMTARGLRVHRMTDILPGYPETALDYVLSPRDTHPNVRGHAVISEYVLDTILGGPAGS